MNHANEAIWINRLILAAGNRQIPSLTSGNILHATIFLGFRTCRSWRSHCAASLHGTGVLYLRSPSPQVTNASGCIQLHSFITEASIDNADNKLCPCARVLALCRFCFISSLSCSHPFFLPGCLTSDPSRLCECTAAPHCAAEFMSAQGSKIFQTCASPSKKKKKHSQDYTGTSEGRQDSFVYCNIFSKRRGIEFGFGRVINSALLRAD